MWCVWHRDEPFANGLLDIVFLRLQTEQRRERGSESESEMKHTQRESQREQAGPVSEWAREDELGRKLTGSKSRLVKFTATGDQTNMPHTSLSDYRSLSLSLSANENRSNFERFFSFPEERKKAAKRKRDQESREKKKKASFVAHNNNVGRARAQRHEEARRGARRPDSSHRSQVCLSHNTHTHNMHMRNGVTTTREKKKNTKKKCFFLSLSHPLTLISTAESPTAPAAKSQRAA
jgi:hypothetical protein